MKLFEKRRKEAALRVDAACLCDIGLKRKSNQDNVLFAGQVLPPRERTNSAKPEQLCVSAAALLSFGVFDGMGGESYGEFASFEAANALKEQSEAEGFALPDDRELKGLFEAMDTRVGEMGDALRASRVGTTAVILLLQGSQAVAANVGDSRAYLYRDGQLRQLSVDHLEEEALPGRSRGLVQYLGMRSGLVLEPKISRVTLQAGDCLLLCSDGFSGAIADDVLRSRLGALLTSGCSAGEITAQLVEEALVEDGKDNTTLLLCRIVAEEA